MVVRFRVEEAARACLVDCRVMNGDGQQCLFSSILAGYLYN